MSKCRLPLVKALSKERLLRLIRLYGLQTSMFDREMYILDWEGLEYQFHISENRILLHCVVVRMDVVLCGAKKVKEYIY